MARNRQRMPILERWARLAHRRRGRVIGVWVAALVALVAIAGTFGAKLSNDFTLPGSESQHGLDLLESRFPARSGGTADLVFQAPAGVSSPEIKARIEQLLTQLKAEIAPITEIESPYAGEGFVSKDGTIARAVVHWDVQGQNAKVSDIEAMLARTDAASGNGLRVVAGGDLVAYAEVPAWGSESIGLIAAIVILFLAFGSLVAMGLPIAAALFGIGSGVTIITVLARVIGFPDWTTQFASMIGIGVGIDYSLLVITRFREGLHSGKSVEDSVALAVSTAGRAVIFAGVVVAIAFFGLYAMGLPFIASVGTGAAIVVAMAVVVAITLMPSLLSLIGTRIDSLRVPFLHSTEGIDTASGWYRLSTSIQRRPWPFAVVAAVGLLVVASPILDIELGFTDAGNNPAERRTRQAYDLLAEGFGPGFNGPIMVVVESGGDVKAAAEKVQAALAGPGLAGRVAQVAPPAINQAGNTAIVTVIPATAPQDSATKSLVHDIRNNVLPGAVTGTGATTAVTGLNAIFIDMGDRISDRMPFLFLGVIGLSFLLLMTVFRSVLVALKAAIMNLLSIGAAYGVVVVIFQWGWFGGVLGIEPGPVETFLPMMFFAILFGLSMDYEVFLISRIREEYLRTGDNATAVAHGLTATARVITAAAAIMIAVFLAFVLGPDRVVKEMGLGLAAAIFFDATVVRLILVPATMELLGNANWWMPHWLDRILPQLHLEGHAVREHMGAPAGAE